MTRVMAVLCSGLLLVTALTAALHTIDLWAAMPLSLMDVSAFVALALTVVLIALRVGLRSEQRAAWAAIGTSVSMYVFGYGYSWFQTLDAVDLPFPSPSDVAYILFYPAAAIGILLLLFDRTITRRSLLDGAIAGFGVAAVFSAAVIDLLIGFQTTSEASSNLFLIYPICDAILVGAMTTRMALVRSGSAQNTMVLMGFGAFVVADTCFTAFGSEGEFVFGSLMNVLYLAGVAFLGLAASQRTRPEQSIYRGPALAHASLWFALAALGVLIIATRVQMSAITVVLASSALVAVVLRVLTTLRDLEGVSRARYLEARRDPLTGLANRRAMLEHLDMTAEEATPEQIGMLLLDLNRFKQVNDTHGHQVGDHLLEHVAARLRRKTRTSDLVARLGGDEFVVIVPVGPDARKDLTSLAQLIRSELRGMYRLNGPAGEVEVDIDVSIGAALLADADVEILLRDADAAMYQAKRAGGGLAWLDQPDLVTPTMAAGLSESSLSLSEK